MSEEITKLKPPVINVDQSLKTLWVDHIDMALRDDDMCLVRFATHLPEGFFEQAKIMTGRKHMLRFIDVLCEHFNYYPEKKEGGQK